MAQLVILADWVTFSIRLKINASNVFQDALHAMRTMYFNVSSVMMDMKQLQ